MSPTPEPPGRAFAAGGAVLDAFDRQIRQGLVPAQPGWTIERVGPVIRGTSPEGAKWGCYVEWSDLDAGTADAAIAEQLAYYGDLGRRFEWKTYGYDTPADLTERLLAAGFVAEEVESLVIGQVSEVVDACAGAEPPGDVEIRIVDATTPGASPTDPDWVGMAELHDEVWGERSREWVASLFDEAITAPDDITIFVADTGSQIACAGWVRFHAGTDFASLWGGSTRPGWRRRGIYRTLVGRRAALAAERGFRYLQVDASSESRPILERLGLHVLTTTTPYVWPAAQV